MISTRYEEHSKSFRCFVVTRVVIDASVLERLLRPAKVVLVDIRQRAGGQIEYAFDVARASCPWSPAALLRVFTDRLVRHATTSDLFDVDGSPFPNRATEVVFELMQMRDSITLEAVSYQWKKEIRSDSKQWNKTVCEWPTERNYFARLENRITRRCVLVTWLDHYFKEGSGAADNFGQANGLL